MVLLARYLHADEVGKIPFDNIFWTFRSWGVLRQFFILHGCGLLADIFSADSLAFPDCFLLFFGSTIY